MPGQRLIDRLAYRLHQLRVLVILPGAGPGRGRQPVPVFRFKVLGRMPPPAVASHLPDTSSTANRCAHVVNRLSPRKLCSLPKIASIASSAA
jgi:hypothetical protein